jgi:hypothetical protein
MVAPMSMLVTIALASLVAAPGPAHAVLTVEAGALDRDHTPVDFELPAGTLARAGALELRDGAGRRLPLQVSGGQGHFVLPALGRGKRASYEIVEASAAPAPGVEIRREADSLVVLVAGSPVFHFRTRAPSPTAEVPARFTRAGYLHPVFSPGGVVVTDDSPRDHGHHHGIWTAWTVTEFEGRHLSFWGPEPGRSKNDLVSVGEPWSGPLAAGFSARLASTDLSVKPPRQVLDSQWQVIVHRTHQTKPPYFLFDLEWTDKVVGDKPLLLPEYRYGGLGVRGNREWLDPNRVTFLTSEGKDRLAGENSRVRWVHLGGAVSGPGNGKGKANDRTAGLAVLVSPSNLRAPEPVRLNPGIPELCLSPPKAGPLSIEPGKPYTARYRFVVSDGPAAPALLERLWRDYARPPVVKVEPAASRS